MIQTQLKFLIHLNLIPFLLKTYLASLIKNYLCLFDDSINKGWMDIFIWIEQLNDVIDLYFFSSNVQTKLNADPYDTRGEEIRTRYEDDYKFHRYTNRYGNAFGSEFYTIRITCRCLFHKHLQLFLASWFYSKSIFPPQYQIHCFIVKNFRSILTDPEIHQKLHDSHYEQQSRYYGYWYGTDLYAYDSQVICMRLRKFNKKN